MAYDVDLADRLREILAAEPDVTEKRMFGGLAFMVAGHMAVSVSGQGGLLSRIDPAQTETLVGERQASRFMMRGREMDGWLRVNLDARATDVDLTRWVRHGVAYAKIDTAEVTQRSPHRSGRRSTVEAQLFDLAAPRMVRFTSMDNDDVFDRARSNRLLAADMFAGLTVEQWRTPSLCAGWTVRDVAGHMIMPMEITFGRFLLRLLSERGSFDRAADKASRALAQRPTEQIVAILREKADSRFTPPGIGALGPMTDTCVHLRDAARPLGLQTSPPLQDWRLALDFLVSPTARRGFVPRGRLDGLTLGTSDQEWTAGAGPLVKGPSEAVALAIAGRTVALEDLTGDGVAVLRDRLLSG